jgi:flagellar basal-body rod protein FlgF
MSTGIWIAASGAVSQMAALDATANNVANAATPAFRAEQAVFREHLIDAERAGSARVGMRYNGVPVVATDMTPGTLKVTNRPLDFAIRSDAFLAVQTPQGERYTRAGNLFVDPSGALALQDGTRVLNTAGQPVFLPNKGQGARITAEGGVEVDGQPMGQLRFVRFQNTRGLDRQGHTLFAPTANSGGPTPVRASLEVEALEMTNVSVVKGMTDMVTTTRSFDAITKVIDTFRDIEQRAANDIMRRR